MANIQESAGVLDSIKAARKSPDQIAKLLTATTKQVQVGVVKRPDNGLGRIRRPSEDRNNKGHGKYTELDARRRKRNRVVVIREEFVELTTDPIAAALLGQFNFYQTLAANKEGDFLMEEKVRESMHGDAGAIIPPTCGWFYKSMDELCAETFKLCNRNTASKIIQKFINAGWLMVRNNPKHKWDKTRYYRLDSIRLKQDLAKLGLELPGWNGELNEKKEERAEKSAGSDKATQKHHALLTAFQSPEEGNQLPPSVPAIPEGTTEGTIEEEYPLPFLGKRETNLSSKAESTEPPVSEVQQGEVFPDPKSPAFPRIHGYPDWQRAVEVFDADRAAQLASVFPNSPQTWPSGLARIYVRVRRNGTLSDPLLALVLLRYRDANNSFSGSPNEDYTWKARSLREFLSERHLQLTRAALREDFSLEMSAVSMDPAIQGILAEWRASVRAI